MVRHDGGHVEGVQGAGKRHEPFNSTPMGVNPISSGSPHVRLMGRTCGEPDEIKKNVHPKYFTALFRAQVLEIVQLQIQLEKMQKQRKEYEAFITKSEKASDPATNPLDPLA